MKQRNSTIKRALATLLAVGPLAAVVPATAFADGGGSPPPPSQGGGGSGGGP